MPAISSKISHVAGFRLATLASTQPHAVVNTNLQKRFYTTRFRCVGHIEQLVFDAARTAIQDQDFHFTDSFRS